METFVLVVLIFAGVAGLYDEVASRRRAQGGK
jgi:hypothetical protein